MLFVLSRSHHTPLPSIDLFCSSTINDVEESTSVPSLENLANFLAPRGRIAYVDGDIGTCIMCGRNCPCVRTKKDMNISDGNPAILLSCKSVCTDCHNVVWKVVGRNICIKWCNSCRQFRLLGGFQGVEGAVKSCTRCRKSKKKQKRPSVPNTHDAGLPRVSTNRCVKLKSLSPADRAR